MPVDAQTFCLEWFDTCTVYKRDNWYNEFDAGTKQCEEAEKKTYCQKRESSMNLPKPGCKVWSNGCASCERDSATQEWFCSLTPSTCDENNKVGKCTVKVGATNDFESKLDGSFIKLVDDGKVDPEKEDRQVYKQFLCKIQVEGK